ncbi:hypothetical protein [Haemophilus influenzae]|uniref:hypothetical protein n=1 Tax=Haemophilus influenzae TaxID=727 RepID=UPI003DA0971C
MSRSTLSPFDDALAQADKVITDVMMSVYVINGKKYKAVLDQPCAVKLRPSGRRYKAQTA